MKITIILLLSLLFSCGSLKKLSYNKTLDGFDYPYEVQEFALETQGETLKMAYGDLNPSAKKVLVLLHGKNFSGYYWDKIAKTLAKKGYRVIIPDQIGFGKSSKPRNYQYSLPQLSLNTLELMKSLKVNRFEVIGHSMGGMLAVHLASMSAKVSRLTLINPIGLEDYLKYVEFKDVDFFYEIEKKKTVDAFRNYQKKNYYDGKWKDEYEALLKPFKGWRNGKDYELVAWNSALTYQPIFANPITDLIKQLTIPMNLILGTRDRTGPGRGWKKEGVSVKLGQYQKLGGQIKKLNPDRIYLVELKGLGHMPQVEDYERFSKSFYSLFF